MGRNIVAIIQARMSSSRLPGKVLKKLAGIPVLEHVHSRVSHAKLIHNVVVATSTDPSDDQIEEFCAKKEINCFRGDLKDVLSRYYHCAVQYKATHVMRITADCPLVDPVIIDSVILSGVAGNYDCFGINGSFPNGLDCTLLSMSAISNAYKNASLPSQREHVWPYIGDNPNLFKLGHLEMFDSFNDERWTLDEEEDYELLNVIFRKLYRDKKIISTLDVLELMESNPSFRSINSHITRNEGYIKSLKEDRLLDD